jgi:hypothetical protein
MSSPGDIAAESHPRLSYPELLASLRSTLDAGIEPADEDLEMLSLFRHPDSERDLAQLFYRRALLREERLEREEAAARARDQASGDFDDHD